MSPSVFKCGLAISGWVLLSESAAAHHSYAQFDRCTNVTIKGEISDIAWANPHIVITIDSADAPRYRVEWFDLSSLRRAGLATGALTAGDEVVITGARNRDPDARVMTLLTELRRPSDGWRWSRTRERPTECVEQ
jgi:Family of unknown function (DUF6152)